MRMLRWETGKIRLDHVRNVDIWKEAHMYPMVCTIVSIICKVMSYD